MQQKKKQPAKTTKNEVEKTKESETKEGVVGDEETRPQGSERTEGVSNNLTNEQDKEKQRQQTESNNESTAATSEKQGHGPQKNLPTINEDSAEHYGSDSSRINIEPVLE